jgi:hypothetical protein
MNDDLRTWLYVVLIFTLFGLSMAIAIDVVLVGIAVTGVGK